MQAFDIIVIGAGPAGSAAATWAAKAGACVALVDKARFPRTKLCGGLFTERSRAYYREIFDREFDLTDVVSRDEIEFWHQGECLAKLNDIPPLHLTMRLDLDNRLYVHALKAGVQDFTGRPVASMTDTSVTFRDGECLETRILIGADGVNSVTARHLFGAAFDKQKIGFGLEIEAPGKDGSEQPNPLRIDFAAAIWGYGWSFPKTGSTTIGVGGLLDLNPDMKDHFSTYLSRLGLDPEQQKFKGHYLPFGDFRETPGRKNVLLAGDAAGLVDPITGEGIAFAMKYNETDNVCMAYTGDGAMNQGQVYEAFNMAALWKLPVIYVIENNKYGMGTSVERISASGANLHDRGKAYGIPGDEVDGMDVVAVHEAAEKAVAHCRAGKGPYILEMKTYRYRGHSMSDPAKYRSKEEVNKVRSTSDPIDRVKATLIDDGHASEEDLKEIDKQVKAVVSDAADFAQSSPEPDVKELWTDVLLEA